MTTFKSYSNEKIPVSETNWKSKVDPILLPGENCLSFIEPVYEVDPLLTNSQKFSREGTLFCTNFRLQFTLHTYERQELSLLSPSHFMTLCSIDQIISTSRPPKCKQKNIKNSKPIKFNFEYLEFHMRDIRILKYDVSKIGPSKFSKFFDSLICFRNISSFRMLPAFKLHALEYIRWLGEKEFLDEKNSVQPSVGKFLLSGDWKEEIERLNAKGYVICESTSVQRTRDQFPTFFVKKSNLADEYSTAIWSYTRASVSLLRCSENARKYNVMLIDSNVLLHIQSQEGPYNLFKMSNLPTIQNIQEAYELLKPLGFPSSWKAYRHSDKQFLSQLENSRWLHYVSVILSVADHAVHKLCGNIEIDILINELKDCDVNCVLSSLIQLLLDESYRSISGFQRLIDKEWITRHPFPARLGLVSTPLSDSEQPVSLQDIESYLFLFFLDCVHQLIVQFPGAFEFTSSYLCYIWECALSGMFMTFCLPNADSIPPYVHKFPFLSAWQTEIQLSTSYTSHFYDPYYFFVHYVRDFHFQKKEISIKHLRKNTILKPKFNIAALEFWSEFWFRNISFEQSPLHDALSSQSLAQDCISDIVDALNKLYDLQLHTPWVRQTKRVRKDSVFPINDISSDDDLEENSDDNFSYVDDEVEHF